MAHNVTIIANRGGPDLNEAMTTAVDAALASATKDYRMAGFPRPSHPGGERFYHLFEGGAHLALCSGMAVVSPDRLRPADLGAIDCVTCLHQFTVRTRGRA